jgi:regulatory protein
MKITALKQQVKKPERVSVFVDDKYEFSLSLSEVVKYGVKNGLEIDEADLKKYKKLSEDGKVSARALEWVLNRPHSIREFRDYMFRKKADLDLTEKLINQFSKQKYLDEEAYGKWLIELRSRAGKSNRAIKAELRAKWLDRELVDQLIEVQGDGEEQRLRELVAKKQKLSRYRDPLKLKQYLAAQGFSYDLIKSVLADTSPQDT